MRSLLVLAGTAALLLVTPLAGAEVEVLTPEMLARLEAGKERPLALAPDGDAARFLSGDGDWQEGAPPLILDLDRDGVEDFLVASVLDVGAGRRAIIIYEWGDAAGVFGKAVFYLIMGADGEVAEWAGKHALAPRPRR